MPDKTLSESEDRLVRQHLGLAVFQARSFSNTGVTDTDDYIQDAAIGLLKAIRTYDPKRGSFATYARSIMHNEIMSDIRKFDRNAESLNVDVAASSPQSKLTEFLPNLDPYEYATVCMRSLGFTNREIANTLEFSKEWIRRLFRSAVQKIRDANK